MAITRIVRPKEIGLRPARVATPSELVVESRTLGGILSYAMATDDLTRSSMLLKPGPHRRPPFQVNTLVELMLDPGGTHLERPVACLGKVVKLGADESGTPTYGVEIVQIETRDLAAWESYLHAVERERTKALGPVG
jgi:hypothetical protein